MHDPDPEGRSLVDSETESDLTPDGGTQGDVVIELLMRWEEARARGEELTAEELCGSDLRWLPLLRERIEKRKRLHRVLAMPNATETGQDAGSLSLPAFPGHEVLGEIGRGGMGVVYRALDVRLGRIVALKTLAEARYATRDQLERFLDEARAVARLRHPNIVAIHAIDEHEHRPYFSLEYVEGGNLAQRLAKGTMLPREAAELVELLARAVHVAHLARIIHRDLKPSNVLLTADGVPKVGDFGLAKLIDSDSSRTYSGQVMGTPSYMAPEQAEGRSREVSSSADIYALGAILYHTLIGRPPFLGDSALETLKLVTTTEAVSPARLRSDVPRDLETICLKCLEKSPARRYGTAFELAEDLRRFQEYRPIMARPISVAGRAWRWAGRNRMLATAGGLVLAMFTLGTPGFFLLWRGAVADRAAAVAAGSRAVVSLREAQEARRQADAARAQAERVRDRALSAINALLMTEAEALPEELRPYRRALADKGMQESEELVRALEGDSQAEGQRVYGYLALSGVQLEAGDSAAARASGQKAIELAELLAARNPSVSSRELLGMVFHRLTSLGTDWQAIRSYAARSNEILESADFDQPGRLNPNRHAIALNYHNLGHVNHQEKRFSEAVAAFEAGVRFCREQIRRGDKTDPLRLDLGRNLLYLSRAERSLGRMDQAAEAGEQAVAVYRALYDRGPFDYATAIQLHLSYEEVSFAYEALERKDETIAALEASRGILKNAVEKSGLLVSRVAAIQGQLARIDYNLTRAYSTNLARYYQPIRALYAEAFTICDKLSFFQRLSDDLRAVFADASYQKASNQVEDGGEADLELYQQAERIWADLHRDHPTVIMYRAMLVVVRLDLADEMAARGRSEEARVYRERSLSSARGEGELFFLLAQNYAGNVGLLGTYPIKLDPKRLEERRRLYIGRACHLVREAMSVGFRDLARVWREPEFKPLLDDAEFRSVVSTLDTLTFPADPFAKP